MPARSRTAQIRALQTPKHQKKDKRNKKAILDAVRKDKFSDQIAVREDRTKEDASQR